MYCCQIKTNIPIITPSTVSTSRVTVNITFRALDISNLYAEDNCRKNNKLQRLFASIGASLQYKTKLYIIYKATLGYLIFHFKIYSQLSSHRIVIQKHLEPKICNA